MFCALALCQSDWSFDQPLDKGLMLQTSAFELFVVANFSAFNKI